MRYSVSHITTVKYAHPVRLAQFNVRLRPADWRGQTVSDFTLTVDPQPPRLTESEGGYHVNESRFAFKEPVTQLQVESRFMVECEPLPFFVEDAAGPGLAELRELAMWSEGQVWCSPERHGQITGIMKAQIDHLPLEMKGMRPTQGRTLAVMQVSGGSQSFNAVNTLRLLGRWMRMFTIPNQSSVAMAYKEFDEAGRMKPSSYYDRIVDVMEELVRFIVLLRPHTTQLVDRYSERKQAGVAVNPALDPSAIAIGASSARA